MTSSLEKIIILISPMTDLQSKLNVKVGNSLYTVFIEKFIHAIRMANLSP